jgi:large repetitive protein
MTTIKLNSSGVEMCQRIVKAALASLALASGLLGTANAAHTSTVCPAKSATVATGGTVTIDVTDCDPFVGFAGIGPVDGPLFPAHGAANLRIVSASPGVPFRWYVDYSHNGNSATSDAFEFTDASGNETAVSIVRVTITITGPTSPISVSPPTLPALVAGTPISQTLSSTGGAAPYTYTLQSGTLPVGLTLSNGVISGTPTRRGAYTFSVRSTDSTSPTPQFTDKGYTGNVQNPTLTLSPSTYSVVQNVATSFSLSTAGGVAPHSYQTEPFVGAAPAPGLTMNAAGLITGTPSTLGSTITSIRVTDASTPSNAAYFELESLTIAVVPPPSVLIAVAPASVNEDGSTQLVYTVSRSVNLASPTTVNITTSGTATSGTDYTGAVTTVIIPAGATSATISIDPSFDVATEADETVILTVVAGTGYTVGAPASATGTIVNVNPPTLSIGDVSVIEGNSGTVNAVFNVTLSAASSQNVTVNFATADGSATQPVDYAAASGTVTFTPGQTSRTITVSINGDSAPEANEIFFVNLSGATNAVIADGQGQGTITNDDASVVLSPTSLPNVAFNAGYNQTITATGGSGSYSFTVTSGALPGGLTLSPSGALSGTATAGGTFNFTITATDTSAAPGPFTGARPYSIVVAPIAQTVSFVPASPVAFGAAPITLAASASSGLSVFTFATTSASSICTVSGNQLTIVGTGSCALSATQGGNANYNAASANANVVINPANQTVTFSPATPVTFGAAPVTLTATASSGLTSFTFSATSAATVCTVTGNMVTFTGGGTCALTVTQPGNANYNSGSANANIVINPASQTLTFAPATPVTFGAAPVTLTATASSGLTSFTFNTTSAATVCAVTGNTVTFTGGGVCALTATQPGNANYTSASANANIVINAANQTVSFAPATPVTFGAAPQVLSASASSGLTVFNFTTSSAPSICTVAGNAVTFVGAGSCTLTATQPGNASYANASANATIVINAASQTVTFAPASPIPFSTVPITLSATASSGLTTFTFSSASAATICTLSANQLTIVGTGTCNLTATQPGDANFNSASANASIVINAAAQTLTFTPASPVSFGSPPIALSATASSGLTAFTFSTSAAATICTVSGSTLTVVGVGTCGLTVSQAGDANYTAASANATVVIEPAVPGAPTIGIATPGNMAVTVAFIAPLNNGGSAITGYTVTCTDGPNSSNSVGASSPLLISGLVNGTTYNCTVVATNVRGDSAPSASVTVTPSFRTHSASAAVGGGTISATFSGGGAACSYTTAQYIALSGHPASPPAGSSPAGVLFPHGLFDFTTSGCVSGSTITMTITYPQPLPPGTQYWKYGPTPSNPAPSWYVLPATIADNTATFTITDGQLGDDDLSANGTVVDQGGPGAPPPIPVPLPIWWLLMLALACAGAGYISIRSSARR